MTSNKEKYFLGILFIFGSIFGVRAGPDHKRLLANLFKDYNINERPINHENDTLNVSFGLTIMSIVDVNIAQSYMEANIWLTVEWFDFHLKWDPTEYGEINTLSIPVLKIWKPDIHLYNSIDPNFDPTYPTNAVVKNNGSVTYIPPGIFRSTCQTDVTHYPFDEQKCTLKFGSWTWDGEKLNVSSNADSAEISSFVKHNEWELLGAPAQTNKVYYACCSEPYIDVTFVMHIRRRGEWIFAGSRFALIIGAVSVFVTLMLPTNSGQRITLGVVILLALSAMSISISNDLGGRPTILVSCFSTLSFLTFASIAANIFILYFYNRNPFLHKMPSWMRTVFCEKVPFFILLANPTRENSGRTRTISSGSGNAPQIGSHEQYEELVTDLQVLVHKIGGQETGQPLNDWQYFATVLDRLTLIVYLVSMIIFFISFYFAFA